MNQIKYRPHLTITELEEIERCLKISSQSLSLIKSISLLAIKARSGVITPSYKTTGPSAQSYESRLGFTNESTVKFLDSLKDLRKVAWEKYSNSPESCTLQEIARAHMYRYENDLMSSEEEKRYENSERMEG